MGYLNNPRDPQPPQPFQIIKKLSLVYRVIKDSIYDAVLFISQAQFVFLLLGPINESGIIDSVSEDLFPIPICVRRLPVRASLCRKCCASCGDAGPVLRQRVTFPYQRVC